VSGESRLNVFQQPFLDTFDHQKIGRCWVDLRRSLPLDRFGFLISLYRTAHYHALTESGYQHSKTVKDVGRRAAQNEGELPGESEEGCRAVLL